MRRRPVRPALLRLTCWKTPGHAGPRSRAPASHGRSEVGRARFQRRLQRIALRRRGRSGRLVALGASRCAAARSSRARCDLTVDLGHCVPRVRLPLLLGTPGLPSCADALGVPRSASPTHSCRPDGGPPQLGVHELRPPALFSSARVPRHSDGRLCLRDCRALLGHGMAAYRATNAAGTRAFLEHAGAPPRPSQRRSAPLRQEPRRRPRRLGPSFRDLGRSGLGPILRRSRRAPRSFRTEGELRAAHGPGAFRRRAFVVCGQGAGAL